MPNFSFFKKAPYKKRLWKKYKKFFNKGLAEMMTKQKRKEGCLPAQFLI